METRRGGSVETQPKVFAPGRVPLPRSPIVAMPVDELGKGHAPPKMYEAPKPDPKVAPGREGIDRSRGSRSDARSADTARSAEGRSANWSTTGGAEGGQTKGKGKDKDKDKHKE